MAPAGELLDDPATLERWRGQWDELAVSARRPYCAPAWMLAWWRHAAPPAARLRVAVASEGDELIGLAPCYLEQGRLGPALRVLAAPVSQRVEPLARPGREREAAAVLARTLATSAPRPAVLLLEGVDDRSPWPGLLAEVWPGKVTQVENRDGVAPRITLTGDAEAWLAARSQNLRAQLRRHRRRSLESGAEFALASGDEEIRRAVTALIDLHDRRFAGRGSDLAGHSVREAVIAAGLELAPSDRLRAVVGRTADQVFCCQLLLAAGGEVTYWLGAFDEEWSKYSPSLVGLWAGIEDAYARAEASFDLGYGDQSYKVRLADAEDRLRWLSLVLPGPRAPLLRAAFAAQRGRAALAARAPEGLKARIRGLRGQRPAASR